jgi:hypothetical protein
MSITEEIDSVRNSFDVLLGTFKKDHNFSDKYGDEYSSEFEICGQPGVLEVMPDKTNFIFNYSDEKYVGTADDFQRCFDRFFRELKLLLAETHYSTLKFLGADETFYEFFENDKGAIDSKRVVTLLLSKQAGFMKVVLTFTRYNSEKKPF